MKRRIVIAVALGLAGCKASNNEAVIIAAIESEVRLPVDAHPLNAYARFYAYGPNDVVVGNYLIPPSGPDLKLCEEEKAIEKKENMKGQSGSQYCLPPRGVRAGEHRWMADYKWLPGGHDGGCNFIDVIYDLASERFLKVECHGSVG